MPTEFFIHDSDLAPLKHSVVVITGGSSGIGLATVEVLLSIGAKVVTGDLNPPPLQHGNLTFQKTDVTSWANLKSLFQTAKEKHSRIDHVFANAGITGRAKYLEDRFDDAGDLLEPDTLVYDINLRGMINTAYLGLHHMRHQDPPAGSIVCTASGSSFQRFGAWDYTTSKHGILGWMRGAIPNLQLGGIPIRINCIGPSWTSTGLVHKGLCEAAGIATQSAGVVGKNVAYLMADERRQGQFIYSNGGRYYEVEESTLLPAAVEITRAGGGTVLSEQDALEKLSELSKTFDFGDAQANEAAAE